MMASGERNGYNPFPCCRLHEDENKSPDPLGKTCFEKRKITDEKMSEDI